MPTRDTAWPAGTPCWIDYGAADLDAAKSFYADVLGWSYTEGDSEYGGYFTCQVGEQSAAGMAPQMDPNDPPRWTTYLATDDAEATAALITDAGGTLLVQPMDVGPMGRMAVALDPQGNPFGLWQSGQHTGVTIHNEPGALAWNDVATEDPAAAKSFYGDVFGFVFTPMEGMDDYATFATGDYPLGGIGGLQPGTPKGWTTCFSVASADAALAAVEKGGGKVTMAAMDTPFGRFGLAEDPWAAPFAVMEEAPG